MSRPGASPDPVVIRRYADAVLADVDRQVLAASGIEARVVRDDAGGMLPSLPGMDTRLVVSWADAVRALAILEGGGSEAGEPGADQAAG